MENSKRNYDFFKVTFISILTFSSFLYALETNNKCAEAYSKKLIGKSNEPSFLSKMVTIELPFKQEIESNEAKTENAFEDSIKAIHTKMSKFRLPKDIEESAVLYPMAGFDSYTPLVLFPHAKTYILIDNNTSISKPDLKKVLENGILIQSHNYNASWVHFNQTGLNILFKLLSSLTSVHPKNRIEKIQLIKDEFLDSYSTIIDFYDFRTNEIKKLFFCSGEIGHLEGTLMNPDFRPWWAQVLNHYQPRNLILKGSQSQLRITHVEESASRTQLLKYLKEKGGVLIEGASVAPLQSDLPWAESFDPNRDRWEGSDGDPFLSKPKKEFILEDIEFSYSKKVRMSVF